MLIEKALILEKVYILGTGVGGNEEMADNARYFLMKYLNYSCNSPYSGLINHFTGKLKFTKVY